MLFEFKIYNRELIKVNDRHVVNIDTFNKCKFYFQKDIWDNKEIFVTFIDAYGYSQVIMLGKWDEVLSCTIPDIFLKGKYFKVFVRRNIMTKPELILYKVLENLINKHGEGKVPRET